MVRMFKKSKCLTAVLVGICLTGLIIFMGGCGSKETAKPVTDSSWDKVKTKGEIVVGLCAEYAPFESRNEKNGEIEGFDIDLANALAQELGIKVKIMDAQWESLLGGIEKGDYDILITCMSRKEAANGNVNMSDTYYSLNEVIVVNSADNSINGINDLKGKVVGVQTQTSSEETADKIAGIKEIKRYNRNPEALIDLKNKRIDAVIVGYAYVATQLKNDATDVKIIAAPVASSDIVMVMKKGNDTLTAKINEALGKIKQNGKYDAAVNKWLKVD